MKNQNEIDDIVFFLKKDTLKSYQQAQILLNACVEKRYSEEHRGFKEESK